jgi:membrane-associated HD superfamily phosphohydrolase
MISDSCEAAIRSMDKPDAAKVDEIVGAVITQRMETGQFDNCPITMRDLQIVRQTIVNAFCGLYHQRIKYPGTARPR